MSALNTMRYAVFLLTAFLSFSSTAVEPDTVRHYQYQARYEFGLKLLTLALNHSGTPYQIITPEQQSMNEARGERQVIKGGLDVQWMSTTVQREELMTPIKIPIYRGVLGLRLLLVTNKNQELMSQIKSKEDLKNYVGGHGAHWGDLPVYAANDLPVITYGDYSTLFRLLADGRFDYFHRGLNEIWKEQEQHADNLMVDQYIMLFYPHPVYFFVTKSRPKLARDIEVGLNRASADGSYKALFFEYHQADIKRANLAQRRLIRLENPVIPADPPPLDTSWWMPKTLATPIR